MNPKQPVESQGIPKTKLFPRKSSYQTFIPNHHDGSMNDELKRGDVADLSFWHGVLVVNWDTKIDSFSFLIVLPIMPCLSKIAEDSFNQKLSGKVCC
jgi:hypothetical protein